MNDTIIHQKQIKSPRNRKIYQMREEGVTLEGIGSHFNITKERVRQILKGVDRGLPGYFDLTDTKKRKVIKDSMAEATELLLRRLKESGVI